MSSGSKVGRAESPSTGSPSVEQMSKHILVVCNTLQSISNKAEKATTPLVQASVSSSLLCNEFADGAQSMHGAHPKLASCLSHTEGFAQSVSTFYGDLAESCYNDLIGPLRKAAQENAKQTKKKRKQVEKLTSSLEAAKAKVKSCREKGQTNMVKLMELEEERDAIKKEFKAQERSAAVEFSGRTEELEMLALEGVVKYVQAYKKFFKEGLQRIEEMENVIEGIQIVVDAHAKKTEQQFQILKKEAAFPGKLAMLRRDRTELKLPAPIHSLNSRARDYIRTEEFQVMQLGKKHKKATVKVVLDVQPPEIHITDTKRLATNVRSFEELLQVVRSTKIPRVLDITWRGVDKPMQLMCASVAHRERVYEALNFALSSVSSIPKRSEEVKVFVGTWNVGDTHPPLDVEELGGWIPKSGFDIYAIGTQECEYKPSGVAKEVVEAGDEWKESASSSCETDWFSRVMLYLGDDYVKVCASSLMSMRLIVVVHRDNWFRISNVKKSTEACGIANLVGNKGAVAISFDYNETSLAFVDSHLAAHLKNFEDRNQDWRYIVNNLGLGKDTGNSLGLLNRYHYLFWFGDLNYRLEADQLEVIEKVAEEKYDELFVYDQLNRERVWGKTFVGFTEGPLNFPPTYRYVRGTRIYDKAKGRVPSWCDRVLWKTLPNCPISLEKYTSCDDILTSDHHPVGAEFKITSMKANWPQPSTNKPAFIVISNLQASGLSGASEKPPEASVTFLGPQGVTATTSVAGKSDTPTWAEAIVLELVTHNVEFLSSQHVFVMVRDNKKKEVVDIGQSVISLQDACAISESVSDVEDPSVTVLTPGERPGKAAELLTSKSVAQGCAGAVDFKLKLFSRKEITGTLSGSVRVVWGYENVPRVTSAVVVRQEDQERAMLLVRKKKKTWVKTWFSLGPGFLESYCSDTTSKVQESYPLERCKVYHVVDEAQFHFTFEYMKDQREGVLDLCASSREEMDYWVMAILEASGIVGAVGLVDRNVQNSSPDLVGPESSSSLPTSDLPPPARTRSGAGAAAKRSSVWTSHRSPHQAVPDSPTLLLGSRRPRLGATAPLATASPSDPTLTPEPEVAAEALLIEEAKKMHAAAARAAAVPVYERTPHDDLDTPVRLSPPRSDDDSDEEGTTYAVDDEACQVNEEEGEGEEKVEGEAAAAPETAATEDADVAEEDEE